MRLVTADLNPAIIEPNEPGSRRRGAPTCALHHIRTPPKRAHIGAPLPGNNLRQQRFQNFAHPDGGVFFTCLAAVGDQALGEEGRFIISRKWW